MITREEGDVHVCQKRNYQDGCAEGQKNATCKNQEQKNGGKTSHLLSPTFTSKKEEEEYDFLMRAYRRCPWSPW